MLTEAVSARSRTGAKKGNKTTDASRVVEILEQHILLDGFRVIIASSFADIFANNCFKNGLLPVTLDNPAVAELMCRAQQIEGYRATVDLELKTVRDDRGFSEGFEIDDFQRYCLLEGLDDIGLTLKHEAKITEYESTRATWRA